LADDEEKRREEKRREEKRREEKRREDRDEKSYDADLLRSVCRTLFRYSCG
jgi:hypothetical protein